MQKPQTTTEFPITMGCPPIYIKNPTLAVIATIGMLLPLPLALYLSKDTNFIMPNWQGYPFILCMSLSMIAFGLTGIIRKILYAYPLITTLIFLWPLGLFLIIEKFRNPDFDYKEIKLLAVMLWIFELIFSWFIIGIGGLLLVLGTVGTILKPY